MAQLDWKPKDLRLQGQAGEEEDKLDFLKDPTSWQLPFGGGQTFGQLGQGFRDVSGQAVNLGLKGLEWALTPFSFLGMQQPSIQQKLGTFTDPLKPWERPKIPFGEFLPGGELRERYRDLPVWQQLLAEAPAWMLAAPISATGIRAALATTSAKGGAKAIAPEVVRTALAPLAGVEAAVGWTIGQTVGRASSAVFTKVAQEATKRELRRFASAAGIKLSVEAEKKLMVAYEQAFRTHLGRELTDWVARTRADISKKVGVKAIEHIQRHASPKWAANQMMEALGKGIITPKMITATADTVARQAVKPLPALLDSLVKPMAVTKPPVTPTALERWGKPFTGTQWNTMGQAQRDWLAAESGIAKPRADELAHKRWEEIPIVEQWALAGKSAAPVTPEITSLVPRTLGLPLGVTPVPVTVQPLGGLGRESLPEPIQNWLGDRTVAEGIRSATAKLKLYEGRETPSALARKQITNDLLTQLRVAEEPRGVAFLEAPPPMKTYKQLVHAHAVAKQKLLITVEGKPKPQYRHLAEVMTGKKSMKDMTEQEAATFIDALEKLSEPVYKKGELVPPTIPRTKKVVPENYFQMQFKEPTLVRLLTSQTYYAQKLGVKPLVEPLELAKQRQDLEFVALSNVITEKGQLIDKIAKTPLQEKVAAKLVNRPTDAIEEMGTLVDTYEDPPDFLSDELRPVFTWFRNLTKTFLNGQNEVRRLLNMPEIQGRKAYMRHVANGLAHEIMRGKYPLPEGLKYWASELVGNKVFNPMERHRKLASDLEEYYTKDLIYAMKSMVYTALKEIHLSQPLRSFTEQLAALSKDLPVYKSLSSREVEAMRSINVIPASTKKWVVDYVNQVIKGQPTGLDEQVNRMLINKGIAGVFNFFLKPFGRSLGTMPITKLAQVQGRLVIAGAMGWRPKQLIRNKFQLVQNLALYTVRANLKAIIPPSGTLLELMDESLFLRGYTGMEELPVGIQGELERKWLAPFQWTARTNAMDGMKAAYHDTEELVKSPKYSEYGWADPQRTYTEPKDFLYPSERKKILYEMEFGAGATQYQYIGMAMPELFRHKTLIPLTRLQSWWMNYFFKFHREAITRAFTGKTGYGARLPWSRRLGWFRYLILGGAILVPMGYTTSYLTGVLPSRLAPVAQITMATYEYATAKNDWQRGQALRKLYNSWQVMIPTGLAFKEFREVFTGERSWQELFFYGGMLVPEEGTTPQGGWRKR